MTRLLYFSLVISLSLSVQAQDFTEQSFKYDGACALKIQISKVENGSKITVSQCITQSSSVTTLYRVNVIAFKTEGRDREKFLASIKEAYALLGTTSSTTLKGEPAVQLIEDVTIEGYVMKQITTTVLYNNKSIAIVLATTASSYNKLLTAFKKDFSFL
jgi:hypothetical protein